MKKLLQTMTFGIALTASVEAAEWHEWNTAVGNGHFYTVTDTAMTWFDARSEAADAGGYLTSIGSIEELDFIRTTFGRTELFWTGLSTINGNAAFEWDNGEPITFTYFGAHQPDSGQTSAVVINQTNSRGFTRGFFFDAQPGQLYRGIIENNTDPNAQIPDDDDPTDPKVNPVPDGGATAILLGGALIGMALYRGRRR
jgi:hypothetical protein